MTRIPSFDGRASFDAEWQGIASQINRVFDNGHFANGRLTRELEDAIEDYTGARHAVGVNSGTDALQLILRAAGIGEGAEVIVPAFTVYSTALAVSRAGATPVFVDVEPGSYTMAPDAVRGALTGRTGAIMPVHLFAQMADMTALRAVAGEAGVLVVEDSAQAIGMRRGGVHAGLLGAAGALSFSPAKTLGALGDAGMVITDDAGMAELCAILRHHGRIGEIVGRASDVSSTSVVQGVNSKMDEIQAAVLLTRLARLDGAIARRSALAALYTEGLEDIAVRRPAPTGQVWSAYVIEAERRDELARHLAEAGIQTEIPCAIPLHLQPRFRHLHGRKGDHPVAKFAAERTLALPMYPDLRPEEVNYVCHAIERFAGRSRT